MVVGTTLDITQMHTCQENNQTYTYYKQKRISRSNSERERLYDDIVKASAYAHWTDFLSMLIYAAANQGRSSASFIASHRNRMKLVLERPCS